MIRGWLSSCGLHSTRLRRWGYIPHSRLFKTRVHFALKKDEVTKFLTDKGFGHQFQMPGDRKLAAATVLLSELNSELGEPVGPWTSIMIDRKRTPTVLFAFKDARDAVRTRMILAEHTS